MMLTRNLPLTRSINTFLTKINSRKFFAIYSALSMGELITVDPSDLKFTFESNKQITSSLHLTNNTTDQHVAFTVKTTNPTMYSVRPITRVVSPKSTCEIIVTMQAQTEAPPDMQCKDLFLIQSVIVSPGTKGITPELFTKESLNVVEECILRVIYVPSTSLASIIAQRAQEVFSSSGVEAIRRQVMHFWVKVGLNNQGDEEIMEPLLD